MERCLEEISAAVLDAQEPLSYRTLSIRSRVPAAVSVEALAHFAAENDGVQTLQLLVKRAVGSDDKSETAAATRDTRARVLSLTVKEQEETDEVLCQQIYALYSASKADASALATTCWAQERQTRNDALGSVDKHAPLSAAAKALYASGIKCAEATARQDFGEEQGEETISAFDAINASAKKKAASSSSSSSFFKSSNKTGFSKAKTLSHNGSKTASSKPETKKIDMSNVLTVDSDDEEDDETDAPVFVKTKSNGRGKRIISDEDDDEEVEAPKAATTPAPKSRNVKRKLNASPAAAKMAKQAEESEEEAHSNKKQSDDEEESDAADAVVEIATKRRVLVSKTRINEQGYMVTEKTYEEVELTPEEIEKEKKDAKKKLEDKKKKVAAEKAAKAKKEAKKHSGPPKQRDLRSFFSVK